MQPFCMITVTYRQGFPGKSSVILVNISLCLCSLGCFCPSLLGGKVLQQHCYLVNTTVINFIAHHVRDKNHLTVYTNDWYLNLHNRNILYTLAAQRQTDLTDWYLNIFASHGHIATTCLVLPLKILIYKSISNNNRNTDGYNRPIVNYQANTGH